MGIRVKVFTDLLNLGHQKVTRTMWQVCNGNVRWQRGSLCFAEQFVRHRKKLLSGSADVYLAAVVKLPGVPYASLYRGPLLDEDLPADRPNQNESTPHIPTSIYIYIFFLKMTTRKEKMNKYFMKIQILKKSVFVKYKYKPLQEQGRESNKILHILCQVVWRARKKKKKSIKVAFLFNVFNCIGYLR